MLATAGFAVVAAAQIAFLVPVAAVLAIMLSAAGMVAYRFLAAPTTRRSKRIENLSGVWTILLYLSVGAVPLLWRWWSGGAE
jgi:4-hydroxybenzoate polyprenyltransferase